MPKRLSEEEIEARIQRDAKKSMIFKERHSWCVCCELLKKYPQIVPTIKEEIKRAIREIEGLGAVPDVNEDSGAEAVVPVVKTPEPADFVLLPQYDKPEAVLAAHLCALLTLADPVIFSPFILKALQKKGARAPDREALLQTLEFYFGVSRSMPIPSSLRPLRALAGHLQILRASVGMGSIQVALPICIATQGHYVVARQLESGALVIAKRYLPTAGHRTTKKTYGKYVVQQNWSLASARVVDLGNMVFETLQDLWSWSTADTGTLLEEQGERGYAPSAQPTKNKPGVETIRQLTGHSASGVGKLVPWNDVDQRNAVRAAIVVAGVGMSSQSSFTDRNDESCAHASAEVLLGLEPSECIMASWPADDDDDYVPPPPVR